MGFMMPDTPKQPKPEPEKPQPMPDPEDPNKKIYMQKQAVRRRRRSGRASTILSNNDTLG